MEQNRIVVTCLALLTQQTYSAALPNTVREISSAPRDVYDTPRTEGNSDAAGAAGDSGGSINLKKRDQVAIIVVASLVVVIGVTSAVLYYLAKKRQWQVRASIRRSARRIAEPFSPRTPKNMTHGRREGTANSESARRRTRDPNASARRTQEQSRRAHTDRPTAERQKRAPNDKPREKPTDRSVVDEKKAIKARDLEKGETVSEKKNSKSDPSTVSNSSSEPESKTGKSKSWFSFPSLPFGREK